MNIYPKKYSEGKVTACTKKQRSKDGKRYESAPKWVATIKEGTVTEVRDDQGRIIREENGSPKLQTKWRNLSKTFGDIDCSPYGKGRHRGVREAEAAFRQWRNQLVANAESEYAAALAKANTAMASGNPMIAAMPIPEFMEMYLSERKDDGIEASTLEGYHYSAKIVSSYFTDMTIGELDTEALKSFDRYMRNQKGLSATMRQKACKILKQAFDAHKRQIGTDPFVDFKKAMPSPNAASPNPLDAKSLMKLKREIDESDPTPFICAVEIALRTGMRIGEICGLRWQDVDSETGNIYVRNAIGRTKGGTACYEKLPKRTGKTNSDPTRHIPGTPKIKAMFDKRRRFVASQLKAMDGATGAVTKEDLKRVQPSMFVVGTLDGAYANPTVLGRTWRGFSQAYMGTRGRLPTFHDLRNAALSEIPTFA